MYFGVYTTTQTIPTTGGTDVFTQLTSEVVANIAPILVLLGLTVGLSLAMRWFKKTAKVKA